MDYLKAQYYRQLFNLYTHDLPKTICQKFVFADDITLAYRCKSFEEAEAVLKQDLATMSRYFKSWRLKLNLSKTEVSAFHFNNQMADRKLNVHFENTLLNHNYSPKILGIIFERARSLYVFALLTVRGLFVLILNRRQRN